MQAYVRGGQLEQQNATVGVRTVADRSVGRVITERGGRVELSEPPLDGRYGAPSFLVEARGRPGGL